jgi:hypothetical protein
LDSKEEEAVEVDVVMEVEEAGVVEYIVVTMTAVGAIKVIGMEAEDAEVVGAGDPTTGMKEVTEDAAPGVMTMDTMAAGVRIVVFLGPQEIVVPEENLSEVTNGRPGSSLQCNVVFG